MVYDKEVLELWWEYLKRSKNFRIFCDVLVEYPDPEMAFIGEILIIPFVPKILPSSPEKLIFNEILLCNDRKEENESLKCLVVGGDLRARHSISLKT